MMNLDVVLIDDTPENLDLMHVVLDSNNEISFEGVSVVTNLHKVPPVLSGDRILDKRATMKRIRSNAINPAVAIVDMRLQGDAIDDYSGLHLSQELKNAYPECVIILVSSYFASAPRCIKYFELFRYLVDRGRPAEQFERELRDHFADAVKTYISRNLIPNAVRLGGEGEREGSIYVSYSWAEGGYVDRLCASLGADGYKVRRDKEEISFKASIGEFMQELGRGRYVVVVISDQYLRSANCMYELLEVFRQRRFRQRVFPVVFSNARIRDPAGRWQYLRHWKQEYDKLESEVNACGLREILRHVGLLEDLRRLEDISSSVDELVQSVNDMLSWAPEPLESEDFRSLKKAIDEHL